MSLVYAKHVWGALVGGIRNAPWRTEINSNFFDSLRVLHKHRLKLITESSRSMRKIAWRQLYQKVSGEKKVSLHLMDIPQVLNFLERKGIFFLRAVSKTGSTNAEVVLTVRREKTSIFSNFDIEIIPILT